ncbi:MAG TPA: TonB-dependent receptor [Patescibacteria group bacterium]|nr:TonB-dependent receptor [Patescibacteria group bacterium]
MQRKIRKRIMAAVLCGGWLFAGNPALAQETPTYQLEEIVVQAESEKSNPQESTINVKVVSPGKASTIPELLRQSAGIDIQQRAVAGDNQDGTVKLRGFDARRYTVLLNGRQINSAGVMGGQYIDWTTIALNTVEKIQIIKGGQSAAHGNTLGGVINIITKDSGDNGGQINLVTGSQGRRDYQFQYGGNAGKLHFNITGGKTETDAFLKNNDYESEQLGLRLQYDFTQKDELTFGISHTDSRRGFIRANIPGTADYDPSYPVSDGETLSPGGPMTTPNPGSYWKKYNTYYDLSFRHKTDHGFWRVDYWKNNEKRREVNYNAAGTSVVLDRTVISDTSDSLGISGQYSAGNHTYGYGAEYKRLRYGYGWYDVRPAGSSDLYPSQKVDLWGLYVDDNWKIDKRWSAYLGLRYDHFAGSPDDARGSAMRDTRESALSPKLSFTFRNNAATATFFSINHLWRAPSMAEYYWWSQNYNTASTGMGSNPGYRQALKPEQGMGYEVGVEHRFSPKYTSKVTFFYQDIKDYINFQHSYPYYCYNVDQVKVWGAEWENIYKMDAHHKLSLNYTNQHTAKVGASRNDAGLMGELDYRPRHKVALAYEYDAKPWQIRYTINAVSSQKALYNNTATDIGGYTVHNLSITREMGKERTLSFYIDNLFDKKYVEQINYPLPGRAYYVSLIQKI